tara:strand:- start:500 stop:1585 length:1086 start_codon:yes stop_codon:yes gene_type:complete
MNYKYNIDKVLKKNINDISVEKNKKIFICVYEVLFKIKSTNENPFLQYLMYKYQKKDSIGEILTFPCFVYNGGNLQEQIKTYANKLVNNAIYKGYLQFNNNYYIFFGRENKNFSLKKLQSVNKYWWCLIDEICNKKKVINYKFHNDIVNMFLSNSDLIYLYSEKNELLEVPSVAYRGDHNDILNYLAVFGQRRSTRSRFGPFYTLGTFNWAVRWAGWNKYYQKHFFKGKAVTDDNGKYLKGGIIRYAIFLGDLEKNYVILYNKKNYFYHLINYWDINKSRTKKEIEDYSKKTGKETGKWSNNYNSLVVPKIKNNNNDGYFNANTEYIISNNNNKITLSIHDLDMSSLKYNWDPFYENYKIL